MRPIVKYSVGEIVRLEDGCSISVQDKYHPYQDAKHLLCANIGLNCVYCEASYPYPRDVHVEHVLPKDPTQGYSHLESDWDNFLLACATCNGVDNKGNKVNLPQDCHYPHLNNTFLSFKYDRGGVVVVNPDLTGLSYNKAKTLLEMVGLDKSPLTSNPGDYRCHNRRKQWNIAETYRARYVNGKLDIDCLIDYVIQAGSWSIWFTVFEGLDEVRKQLIDRFPGTASSCFDAQNHYNPVPRNPGQIDPV